MITIDGLRWQEVFGGADSSYFKKGSNGEPTDIEKRYARSSPEDGRSALLPFPWVGSGFTPVPSPRTDRQRAINQAAEDLPLYWSNYGTFDGPFVDAAIESLRIDKPRALYVMLGEGDNWARPLPDIGGPGK